MEVFQDHLLEEMAVADEEDLALHLGSQVLDFRNGMGHACMHIGLALMVISVMHEVQGRLSDRAVLRILYDSVLERRFPLGLDTFEEPQVAILVE